MLSRQTFSFLSAIAEHNHREWFQVHKEEYEESRADILGFTEEVIEKLAAFDRSIPVDLNPGNCVMRIYRDIRFSKDKTPYKTNYGIAISATGKNFNGPGYYIHIKPNESFVAAGLWYPAAAHLKAVRQEIDYNQEEWLNVINAPEFINEFGTPDPASKLRSAPKGYPSDHPVIEYLKLKSFTAGRKVDDHLLCTPQASAQVVGLFQKLYPFMVFLRNAIS